MTFTVREVHAPSQVSYEPMNLHLEDDVRKGLIS